MVFEHVRAFLGGVGVGVAAASFLLFNGRIAGVSGLFAQAVGLGAAGRRRFVAIAFVLGLPIGAGLARLASVAVPQFSISLVALLASGLAVGYGTRLGSGCTSGHGVCGISRLSARSLAATGVFMATGCATVAVMRAWGLLP